MIAFHARRAAVERATLPHATWARGGEGA